MKNKPDAAHIEREIGHNAAVALAQQIIKLEDQLAAERNERRLRTAQLAAERLLRASDLRETGKTIRQLREQLAAEREKVAELQAKLPQYEPVQLPMINDDPVVTLK